MLPRMIWAFAHVEAAEVLLDLPKSQLAILLERLSMRSSKELGRALQDDGPLRVLKQLKYFRMPKSLLAILLEQLSMKVSKETGHCFLDFWAFAHVEAAEVLLDTQKSVGHPSGAALHAGVKGDGPLLLFLFGFCAG